MKTARRAVLVVASLVLAAGASAADRPEREQLLQFQSAPAIWSPVRTPAEWAQRRAGIVAAAQKIMGALPGPEKRVPLDVRLERETDCGTFVRREITYQSEPGSRVPAFLLLPKTAVNGTVPARGVLALMATNNDPAVGYRAVVGLAGTKALPGRNYGEELAQRGFAVIVPPYPQLADYQPDLKALGYASGTMKAVWDNIRALDVLAATPGVAPGGFGAIGHSLGGHNAIYTAVFDTRLEAIVSSCGFDSYTDYYREKPEVWRAGSGWTQDRYMPALAEYAGRQGEIPFDFAELIGALAPRPFLAIAPLGDANFKWRSVGRIMAAAHPVYELLGAKTELAVEHPDCPHDFPEPMRARAYAWLADGLRKGN